MLVDEDFSSDTSDDYEQSGTFAISGGEAAFSAMPGAGDALAIIGDGTAGPKFSTGRLTLKVDLDAASTNDFGGVVFSYQDDDNYHKIILEKLSSNYKISLIQETSSGTTTLDTNTFSHTSSTITLDIVIRNSSIYVKRDIAPLGPGLAILHSFADGVPVGRIGICAKGTSVAFDDFKVRTASRPQILGEKWMSVDSKSSFVDDTNDHLADLGDYQRRSTVVRLNSSMKYFAATYHVKSSNASYPMFLRFVYDWQNAEQYRAIFQSITSTGNLVVTGEEHNREAALSTESGTRSALSMPNGTEFWIQIRVTSSGVKYYLSQSSTEPTWSDVSHLMWSASSSTILDPENGGLMGFSENRFENAEILEFRVNPIVAGVPDTSVTEIHDTFDVDSNSITEDSLVHDAAGNLTYDGNYMYTYDAWNRLVKISRAYRDGSFDIQAGSTIATYTYDALGRRIKRQFENQAVNLSGLYHDYYDGHSLIETRAANMVSILKQNVWGLTYVDELVQTSFSPPSSTVYATHNLFVLQSPGYDVMALITPTGHMIERYEYSPSGERFVFGREKTIQIGDADWDGDCDTADEAIMDANDASNGLLEAGDFDADLDVEASGGDDTILQNNLNDSVVGLDDLPEKLYPQMGSTPVHDAVNALTSYPNTLPLCAFGFQGLLHDEQVMTGATTSPVYNRARTWLVHLKRYGQRDPKGYVDGMSLYAGYHVMHGGVDPSGLEVQLKDFHKDYIVGYKLIYQLNVIGWYAGHSYKWVPEKITVSGTLKEDYENGTASIEGLVITGKTGWSANLSLPTGASMTTAGKYAAVAKNLSGWKNCEDDEKQKFVVHLEVHMYEAITEGYGWLLGLSSTKTVKFDTIAWRGVGKCQCK